MKTDRAQRLIGKIGDQYVSLASDAVEAFSLEEERRKRGRGKLRLIAAAAAAVYIILTVSLIIGALTPPNDPVAPPDDGPGAQEQPEQPGEPVDGPEDPNPPDEPGTSPNIYKPTSDQIYESLCASWIYGSNKQPQYRPTCFAFTQAQKFYMVNAETGESVQGTYRMEDNNQNEGKITFSLWVTNDKQELEKYPVTLELLYNNANYNAHLLLVTYEEQQETVTYWRRSIGIENFMIRSGARSMSYPCKGYIETVTVQDSLGYEHNEFSFDIPDNSIFDNIAPITLDGAYSYRIKPSIYYKGSKISYTIYRADGSVYMQNEYSNRADGSTPNYIPTIPDGETYYYHVRYLCDQGDNFSFVFHNYFAIKKNKLSGDRPIIYPDSNLIAPDSSYYSEHLSGRWYPNSEEAVPFWFLFQPDGRVYIINTNTQESTIGRYLLTDLGVDIYTYQDGVGWFKEKDLLIHLDTEKNSMNVSFEMRSSKFLRDEGYSYSVRLWIGDQSESINNFYIEQLSCRGVSHQFDLPDFEIFEQLTPLSFTNIPRFFLSRGGATASYTVYDQNGNLIQEISIGPDRPIHPLQIPDEYGIYYLDVKHTYASQVAHCYIAINYHEEQQPSFDYVPPVLGDNRVSIPLLDCDSPLAHMTLDTQNALHGSGCASATFSKGSPIISPNVFKSPIDATGMDMLEFDLYVSDLSLLTGNFFPSAAAALEITSGGTCDYEELLFTWEDIVRYGLAGQELKQGWNHVIFPLSMAKENSASAEKFDISQIDFIRFYIIDTSKLGSDEYTVKLDNICLTGEQK